MGDSLHGLEVRSPTRADLPAIRELYRATKGRLRPGGYDAWRFFDTPLGDSPSLVALQDRACIALYLMWPAGLSLGGETVQAVQIMDVMTHPDHRRRGLFLGLAEGTRRIALERGFELGYGFPNELSLSLFVRHRNAHHVGNVGTWSADLRGRILRSGRRRQPSVKGVDLDPTRPESGELESLVGELHREPGVCRVEKSLAYLDWRYSEASGERYDWLSLRSPGGELLAASLVGERDEAWGGDFAGVARVHELFARTEEHATLLLRWAAVREAKRGALKLQILVKDPLIQAALDRSGYRREADVAFLVRPFTGRAFAGNVHHFPAWRIISGDMDFY